MAPWLPATLGAESRAALMAALDKNRRRIKVAYLVRKQTPTGEPALHVVGVRRRTHMLKFESSDANQQLVDDLAAADIRDDVLFITLDGDYAPLRKRFKNVGGARLI